MTTMQRKAKRTGRDQTGIKQSRGDVAFNIVNYTVFILITLACIFPFYYLFINTIYATLQFISTTVMLSVSPLCFTRSIILDALSSRLLLSLEILWSSSIFNPLHNPSEHKIYDALSFT